MKRPPADLDQLMWTLAESGDVHAADDFERRFPEWKVELESRIAMVRGLRHAKPAATAAAPEIPKFVLKAKPASTPQRTGWVIALSATAVFAFGTFLVLNLIPPAPAPPPVTPVVTTPNRPEPEPEVELPPDPIRSNPSTSPESQIPPERPTMPWELRHDLSIADAHLSEVLELISSVTKLRVEIAPGMPDPQVSVAYTQRTGMEMLTDLGRQYGFTALEQDRGSVLIVPARATPQP